MVENVKIKRPVLRYFGGKWRLAPWILSFFPEHRVYVEPYGGAASILMQKKRSYAEVYNDLDNEVVNVFTVLRSKEKAEELKRLLFFTPYSREEYNRVWEISENEVEQARRTIVKAYMGYGSDTIFRKNRTGFRSDVDRKGTTIVHDWTGYPRLIDNFYKRLRGVIIEKRPALDVIKQYDKKDALLYIDPPYIKDTRKQQIHGYRYEMTDDDHRELAEVIHDLKGMVILSGYPCDLYDKELYPEWRTYRRKVRTVGSRAEAEEAIWISPNTPILHPELFPTTDGIYG